MSKATAYIALGSNMGDRAGTLLSAVKLLDEIEGVEVRRISQFIETEPEGGPNGQGKFFNAVAQVEITLAPAELLVKLQQIEQLLGRKRGLEERWGPRTCDLDILLVDDLVVQGEQLTIPHPRMHERRFVLEPLASIAPDLVHPALGKTIRDLLLEVMMK